MSTTSIKYKGMVEVTYSIDGKTYSATKHNAGTQELFKLLCRALCGENIQKDKPAYLDVGNVENDEWVSSLSSRVQLTGLRYVQEEGNWTAKATATIEQRKFISIPQAGGTIDLRLGALNVSNLATVTIPSDNLANLKPGMQAIVNWTLSFENEDDE